MYNRILCFNVVFQISDKLRGIRCELSLSQTNSEMTMTSQQINKLNQLLLICVLVQIKWTDYPIVLLLTTEHIFHFHYCLACMYMLESHLTNCSICCTILKFKQRLNHCKKKVNTFLSLCLLMYFSVLTC